MPEILSIRVGFDGHYRVGLWTPIEVVLRGGSHESVGRVSITVPDGEGVASRTVAPENETIRLRAGEEVRVLLYARFGRVHSTVAVRFEPDRGYAVERTFRSSPEAVQGDYPSAIAADRKLVVCFSNTGVGVEEAALVTDFDPDRCPVVVRLDTLAQMPDRWYGYEGVDTVVVALNHLDEKQQALADDDSRLAALDHWIQMGGRLLVLIDAKAVSTFDPKNAWAAFFPKGWKTALRTLGTTDARAARGFGLVTVAAVDPSRAPWNQSADRGAEVARLLGWPKASEETSAAPTLMTHLGFSDISGQLRSALDRFDGVSLVPFGVVVGVMLFYILLVGLGDWWVLSRLKRLGWTWVTFPLVIVVFSAGA
ncbi:MAG TPA: hypothetical protein VJL29_01815, partial [Thermoguttaceae bacterium]|nr:hypothetical protein [Thermoguttaceae bacterium]